MELSVRIGRSLPRLAWLARIEPEAGSVQVLHGEGVERGPGFVVEGAWAGPWERGAFATAATFFGSGVHVGPQGVRLSPSRALVDRIFLARVGPAYVASNSFLVILEALGGRLARGHDYRRETFTVLRGVRAYEKAITLDGVAGPVEQRYFRPVRLEAGGPVEEEPDRPPTFGGYPEYRAYLGSELRALLENARAPGRRAPMVPRLALSRGYDSPAVAVLLAELGGAVAYTVRRSNSLLPSWLDREAALDDGSALAGALGLPVRPMEFTGVMDERLFLASGTGDPELVFEGLFAEAARDSRPTLLFSGYHGDKVWDRRPPDWALSDDLIRGDTSGLALSEARLWAGVVNAAVPFVGASSIASLAAVSQSPQMAPWSVGGDYDRPIPRRIVEEAGIPREAFGRRKRAVVQTYAWPLTPELRGSFARWLRREQGTGGARYRARAWASGLRWAALRAAQKALGAAGLSVREPDRWRWAAGGEPASLLHRWAVDTLLEDGLAFADEVRGFMADPAAARSS